MTHPRPAVHRTLVVVDVEGFGDRRRTIPHQLAVRDGLWRALARAFDNAGIRWAGCRREDRGDGVLILVRADVPKVRFVESLPGALVAVLEEHNRGRCAEERIRLRMAVHAGEVSYDRHGVAGVAVNLAFRLVEADPLRAALAGSPGVLAVIASLWFFEEVIRHSPASRPASYRPVRVAVKETSTVGWICLPGQPGPPGQASAGLVDGPGAAAPRQLPAAVRHFAGREAELQALTDVLQEPGAADTVASAMVGLGELWTPGGALDGWKAVIRTLDEMRRRGFLALSGGVLAAIGHEWLVAEPERLIATIQGKRVDTALTADLQAGVEVVRHLDDRLGGEAVYGIATQQMRLVVNLLRNNSYSQTDGQILHAVAAELARLAGWACYEANQHGAAHRLWVVGLRAAQEARNPGLGANILRCMADREITRGDPNVGVELLRSARAGARGHLTSTEQAVIECTLARGYGRSGNRDAACSASDKAYAHIENSRPEEDPPYIYWATSVNMAFAAGESMLFSGDPRAAIPHLHTSVDDLGSEYTRDLVENQTTLALAYSRAGDIEVALNLAHETIDLAVPLSSDRMRAFVGELCEEIKITGHPAAADLLEHAHTAQISAW